MARAKKRGIKLATAARVLLDERLAALEDHQALSEAEEWQRAQAWATWEKIAAGDDANVPLARFEEHAAAARARLRTKKPTPRR